MSRTSLSGDTTFYISTSGNDATGTGSSAAPWATMQGAWDWCQRNLDLCGHELTFQMFPGTYTSPLIAAENMVGQVEPPKFQGDTNNNWSVIVDVSSTHCFNGFRNACFAINNITMSSCAANCIMSQWGSILYSYNNNFYTIGGSHMEATKGGYIFQNGPYQIWSGNLSGFHAIGDAGTVFISGGNDSVCTVYGTPVFAAFVRAIEPGGYVTGHTMSWKSLTGDPAIVYGARYSADLGGSIGGHSSTYWPGNLDGTGTFIAA